MHVVGKKKVEAAVKHENTLSTNPLKPVANLMEAVQYIKAEKPTINVKQIVTELQQFPELLKVPNFDNCPSS